jgi:ribosomal protein S1
MVETIYGDRTLAYLFEDKESLVGKKAIKARSASKEITEMYGSFDYKIPSVGDIVKAKLYEKTQDEYLFQVDGYKDYIRVDNKGSETKHIDMMENGVIDILITKVNNTNFIIKGSIDAIQEKIARNRISELDKNEPVLAYVKSLNPAGYEMEVKLGSVSMLGFMPNTLAGTNKLYDPNSIVGSTMNVIIESYSESEGTYIVSRKRYLNTLIPEEISKLETHTVYNGRVTGTADFGIFVEFNNCLTGLIYKYNVQEEWQNRIHEVKPGFEIDFYVKEVLPKNKIILTQILREDLWDTIEKGQIYDAVIKDVKPFGILVSLDHETVGLINSAELEKKSIKYTKGDNIKVKILTTDRPNRKISLSVA